LEKTHVDILKGSGAQNIENSRQRRLCTYEIKKGEKDEEMVLREEEEWT